VASPHTFNFVASDPTMRLRRRAVSTFRENSNAFLFPALGFFVILLVAVVEWRALSVIQAETQVHEASATALLAEQRELLAVHAGVNADFSGIATALPPVRESGKTAADRIAAYALVRPNHSIWWDTIDETQGQIVGGATTLEDVSGFASALHDQLAVPTSYSTLGTAKGRRVYVTYTIKIGTVPK
jgi:hypothetical protein